MTEARKAFFVNAFNKNEAGDYVLCIAFEDSEGVYPTDIVAGETLDAARKEAEIRNRQLGLSEIDVLNITENVRRV